MKPVIASNTISLAGRQSYGDLTRERDALREKLAQARKAIAERRYGDALKLTAPSTVMPPIRAQGDLA